MAVGVREAAAATAAAAGGAKVALVLGRSSAWHRVARSKAMPTALVTPSLPLRSLGRQKRARAPAQRAGLTLGRPRS